MVFEWELKSVQSTQKFLLKKTFSHDRKPKTIKCKLRGNHIVVHFLTEIDHQPLFDMHYLFRVYYFEVSYKE